MQQDYKQTGFHFDYHSQGFDKKLELTQKLLDPNTLSSSINNTMIFCFNIQQRYNLLFLIRPYQRSIIEAKNITRSDHHHRHPNRSWCHWPMNWCCNYTWYQNERYPSNSIWCALHPSNDFILDIAWSRTPHWQQRRCLVNCEWDKSDFWLGDNKKLHQPEDTYSLLLTSHRLIRSITRLTVIHLKAFQQIHHMCILRNKESILKW